MINGLHFNNIKGDIYGGLTAAVVALPLAMAMGVASGVGPIAGMYGAIFVGFFAAIIGGTPAQVSGPTGPMTVVMAAIFIQYTALYPDNPLQGAALAFTVVTLGGIFQIGMGLLRIGKYIELVPHPVISGFMSGIGVIIILLQFAPMLGQVSIANPLEAAQAIPSLIQQTDITSFSLAIIAISIAYLVPLLTPNIHRILPSPLLALIIGTLSYILFMPADSTPLIGNIPTGFPEFNFPSIEPALAFQMIASGLTLAALGSIDSLLTSLVADDMTRTQHKPDRELIGQGIGNTVAGLFGGLPGAGATMRTVVNINAGGQTPISGALHALILLAVVLGAGAFASDIPKAVLAGILIKVGTDIIDWDYLKRLKQAPFAGILIMFTVLIITITIDLLLAVGIGMVMASFLFMQRMTELQISNIDALTQSSNQTYLSQEEHALIHQANQQILLFHPSGPMSFSSAKALIRRHAAIKNYQILILDLTDVSSIDFTTCKALSSIIGETQSANRQIFLSASTQNVHLMLQKQQVLQLIPSEYLFDTRLEALTQANKRLKT